MACVKENVISMNDKVFNSEQQPLFATAGGDTRLFLASSDAAMANAALVNALDEHLTGGGQFMDEVVLDADDLLRGFDISDNGSSSNVNNGRSFSNVFKMDPTQFGLRDTGDDSDLLPSTAASMSDVLTLRSSGSSSGSSCGSGGSAGNGGSLMQFQTRAPQVVIAPPLISVRHQQPMIPRQQQTMTVASSSGNVTPTNASPILTPKQRSPPCGRAIDVGAAAAAVLSMQHKPPSTISSPMLGSVSSAMKYRDHHYQASEASSNASSLSESHHVKDDSGWSAATTVQSGSEPPMRATGPFRSLTTGLEPIPEDDVSEPPTVYQPMVPPAIAKPATTSYNISFPTTLLPRERNDFWTQAGLNPSLLSGMTLPSDNPEQPAQFSPGQNTHSSVPPSPGSHSSQQSPFHGALRAGNWDPVEECQPMNILTPSDVKTEAAGGSTSCTTPRLQRSNSANGAKPKASKRSRRGATTPEEEDRDDGASSRQRRKSANNGGASVPSPPMPPMTASASSSTAAENKRRDSIKYGLEELQRVLPHVGQPEQEKISQAAILSEGAKFIKSVKADGGKVSRELEEIKKQIQELNGQIEASQNLLPACGAPLLPKNLSTKSLADMFHDHVVAQTHQNWRYWVFVNIMGHFVHSFDQQVAASTFDELQTTSLEYIGNNMSLQQLRKDAYRKLAKLCAKTSIVDNPSKLPEEAMGFVSRGERAFTKREGPPSS